MARFRLMEGRAVHDAVNADGKKVDHAFVAGRAGDDIVETDDDLTLLNTPGRPPRYVRLDDGSKPEPLDEELLTDAEVEKLVEQQPSRVPVPGDPDFKPGPDSEVKKKPGKKH